MQKETYDIIDMLACSQLISAAKIVTENLGIKCDSPNQQALDLIIRPFENCGLVQWSQGLALALYLHPQFFVSMTGDSDFFAIPPGEFEPDKIFALRWSFSIDKSIEECLKKTMKVQALYYLEQKIPEEERAMFQAFFPLGREMNFKDKKNYVEILTKNLDGSLNTSHPGYQIWLNEMITSALAGILQCPPRDRATSHLVKKAIATEDSLFLEICCGLASIILNNLEALIAFKSHPERLRFFIKKK